MRQLYPAGWFREAGVASPAKNVLKTALQIAFFWTTFLAVVPWAVVQLERRFGWPELRFAGQVPAAVTLFLAASALGLWSGWTMSRRGEGTPLPLDTARRLVVSGPYAYVRNPMAIAGIGQGLAVGIGIGSYGTVGYALSGGVLWDRFVRAAEERDLERRFGDAYLRYRHAVRCWLPRKRPRGATS